MSVSTLNDKYFSLVTLGCRTNHYEAEAIASMLEQRGACQAPSGQAADMVVIVTCSITSVADAKTRKLIRKLRRRYPSALLAATGCYIQGKTDDEVFGLGVDVSVGNRQKHKLPGLMEEWFESRTRISDKIELFEARIDWDDLHLDMPRLHTRAFVKIQEGCNRKCTYCIVPSVRGPEISRAPEDLADEISRIVSSGCREVVLTGIHLGGYRHDGFSLARLISKISAIPGLERLRLGSIEPFSIDDDLLYSLADSPAFCPHIHMPIQSGDDGVLRVMGRGHRASELAFTADRIRSVLGGAVHLSTDLIVGFPGEDDAAFENSTALLQELSFGRVHVFPFSARDGTPAAAMPGRVSHETVRSRMGAALELSAKLLDRYAERWLEKSDSVLIELRHKIDNGKGSIASGLTRHYLKSYFKITENDDGVIGKVVFFNPKAVRGGILFDDDLSIEPPADLPQGLDEPI